MLVCLEIYRSTLSDSTSTFALGKDRIGLLYTPQLTALRRQFTMKVRKKQKVGSRDYVNQEFKRAYALAVWGSFNIEVYVMQASKEPI